MKSIKKVIYVFLLITVFFTNQIWATSTVLTTDTSNDSIISFSSQTVGLNKEFYLILNLSNISYTKFQVDITNTSSLLVDEITESVSNLSTNSVVTSFVVDKNSIGLDKLGVVYTSPSQESVINFSILITSLDKSVDDLNTELTNVQADITALTNTLVSLQTTLSAITDTTSEEYVTVSGEIEETETELSSKTSEETELLDKISNFAQETVEESNSVTVSETADNAWGDKDSMLDEMKEREAMSSNMKKMMEDMESLQFELDTANDRISSLTATESYQGDQNNYLSSLSITGVEFKNSFKKTTNSYFATVDESVTSVTVNAVAEDSDAIITIYGNTDLKSGKNKILINVTAEDGSVRAYKIYVTK